MNRKTQMAQRADTFGHATADLLLTFDAILACIGTLGQVLLLRGDAGR